LFYQQDLISQPGRSVFLQRQHLACLLAHCCSSLMSRMFEGLAKGYQGSLLLVLST
jgi:hypothetical protein